MTTIDSKKNSEQIIKSRDLILSLSPSEEIIQFNKECEQCTGFQRDEVIHRKLGEVLLSKEAQEQWKALFESIRQNLSVHEFILPIKTRENRDLMVSWNGFLIKDTNGSLKDICLYGQPQKTNSPTVENPTTIPTMPFSLKEKNIISSGTVQIQRASDVAIPLNYNRKKILFAHDKEIKNDVVNKTLHENLTKPLEQIEKTIEGTSEKLDAVNRSLKELTTKYNAVSKRLGELERKDHRREKSHKNLVKHGRLLEGSIRQPLRRQKETNIKNILFAEQPLTHKDFTFFSDPFGFKNQHRELNTRLQEIEARTTQLNVFEKQLINERKTFNTRVEEFCRWREKLELLETAIEKRRQELMRQEESVLAHSTSLNQESVIHQVENIKIPKSVAPDTNEIFNEISQSAAIIQRGILKQINDPFVTLLGYSIDEVVETSFFDLVAQDGLADIERYYLDRLKGEDVSVYKTVFSTKDNKKISVEVSIKQTIYNGEKAEIVIITSLNQSESQTTNQ